MKIKSKDFPYVPLCVQDYYEILRWICKTNYRSITSIEELYDLIIYCCELHNMSIAIGVSLIETMKNVLYPNKCLITYLNIPSTVNIHLHDIQKIYELWVFNLAHGLYVEYNLIGRSFHSVTIRDLT